MKSIKNIGLEAPIQVQLQDAFYKTVHHGALPLKSIADEFSETVNYYTKVGLPLDQGGCYYQVQKLPKLLRLAQRYDVLDVLEGSVNRVAVALPPPDGASKRDIFHLALKSIKEFGELMNEVERAMADNVIKPSEREQILKEGMHVVRAVITLMEACKEE